MRWAGHTAWGGRGVYSVLRGKLEGKRPDLQTETATSGLKINSKNKKGATDKSKDYNQYTYLFTYSMVQSPS